MCTLDTDFGNCGCSLPKESPLSAASVHYNDAQSGGDMTNTNNYIPWRTNSTPAVTPSSLPSVREPVLPATDQSFQRTNEPLDMEQPPPDSVDDWFDLLGLSLDATSSENC